MSDKTISESVHVSVRQYLDTMDDEDVRDLYEMVMKEVEEPLLKCVLAFTGNNQSQSALILVMTRGTLRKKLRKYRLL